MPHVPRRHAPPPELEFFIDRSLGRHRIAEALRGIGWSVRTHFEIYEDRDEEVDDVEWLAMAGARRFVVLMKDQKIRRRELELNALVDAHVRAFVLTQGAVTADAHIETMLTHQHRILQRCRQDGPFIYGVHPSGVRPIWPPRRSTPDASDGPA
jgi:hypothetical protein